jgi:hypothetical protein
MIDSERSHDGTWFWLNIPLAAPIFLAMSGIPLRLVLRSPDAGGPS